ncbi:MAG TPA: monovalent cation/H+ antiporter complex subunit F [Acidimicrobiales bacterium]|jgi:multicomponent Na+:H+ antiporter subunit F|nr:monovalent cation/H+ antiporter complex subunit F [Acidimicrobiales bacterium]
MSGYDMLALALLVGGLGPVLVMGALGTALNRLVALELGGALITLFLLVFVEVSGETYELIVPLVLAPLAFAGTLVFTRLLKDTDR